MQIIVLDLLLQILVSKLQLNMHRKQELEWLLLKNSGHYGLSGYYAEQAVKKNLITMIYTNAPPAVAPHGALKSVYLEQILFVLEPLLVLKIPFILDTSISVINRGKIRVAARNNQKIPEGVASR